MAVPDLLWSKSQSYNTNERRHAMLWALDRLTDRDLADYHGWMQHRYPALHRDERQIVDTMGLRLQQSAMAGITIDNSHLPDPSLAGYGEVGKVMDDVTKGISALANAGVKIGTAVSQENRKAREQEYRNEQAKRKAQYDKMIAEQKARSQRESDEFRRRMQEIALKKAAAQGITPTATKPPPRTSPPSHPPRRTAPQQAKPAEPKGSNALLVVVMVGALAYLATQ